MTLRFSCARHNGWHRLRAPCLVEQAAQPSPGSPSVPGALRRGAQSQSFYPVCNAHGFMYLSYLLAKSDKFCTISQANGKYLDAVSEVIGQV